MKRAVLILALYAVGLHAQTPHDTFERGNQLYREGKFRDALVQYESIIKQGYVDAALYYNIGNCHYRLGRVGQAILAYERALRLSPGDPDIQHNLTLANMRVQDRIETLPELFIVSWLRNISLIIPIETITVVFGWLWATLFLSLSAYVVVSGRWLRVARLLSLVVFIGVVLVGGLLTVQVAFAEADDEAIVTSNVVTVKSSPDPQSVDAFVIHEGLKVKMGDRIGEWAKVTLADGKVGWIRQHEVERI